MYEIVLTERFKKDLRKLLRKNQKIRPKIAKQVEILSKNPKHKSLRVHKLAGENNWSMSVNTSIRIIFTFRGNVINCTRIGTHDEVY